MTAGSGSVPVSLESASTRKTGISAARTKPIALGIVHGFSGAPACVAAGSGPERSRPTSRREGRGGGGGGRAGGAGGGRGGGEPRLAHRRRRVLERPAVALLAPAPQLEL